MEIAVRPPLHWNLQSAERNRQPRAERPSKPTAFAAYLADVVPGSRSGLQEPWPARTPASRSALGHPPLIIAPPRVVSIGYGSPKSRMALPKAAAASARPAVPSITRRNAKTNASSMIARTAGLSAGGIDDTCPRSAPAIFGSSRSISSLGSDERGQAIERRSYAGFERLRKHHAEERDRQEDQRTQKQRVGFDHPLHVRDGRVEVPLQCGERNIDDGRIDERHARPENGRGEGPAARGGHTRIWLS
jgi:hypothetical protein